MYTLNELQKSLGPMLVAIIIGTLVFITPKIVFDDYIYLKEAIQKVFRDK